MEDEKKPGATVAGITDEAKHILAEVKDAGVHIGGEIKTLAVDVETLVMETGAAAGAAFSSVVASVWAAAKAKFGKAALLLAVLCLAGQSQAASPEQRGQAAVALALAGVPASASVPLPAAKCDCSGPGSCTCEPGSCACDNCQVKADGRMTSAEASAHLMRTGRSPVSRDGGLTWYVETQPVPQTYYQPQTLRPPVYQFGGGCVGGS